MEAPLPAVWKRITEEVAGNWQSENNQDGEDEPREVWDEGLKHSLLHSLELGEAAEG